MQGGYSPPPPPPPAPVESPSGSPRYVYLLGRLRNRQITMEEATELFAIQQVMIRSASRASTSRGSATAPPGAVAPTGVPGAGLAVMSDEGLALALLAFGTGAGVLAAILQRGRDGPKPVSSSPSR